MQRILLPTDFSAVADNALNYAVEIASKFDSELLLYHIYTFDRKFDFKRDFPEDQQPYIKQLERQMVITKTKASRKIQQKPLTIKTQMEEGSISTLFDKKVLQHDIDLIIMGSKGATGLEKVIFGSVAALALKISKVPVLVVPPKHTFFPIKKIILATDLKKVDPGILLPVRELALKFEAAITILFVSKDSEPAHPSTNQLHFEGVPTHYQEVKMSKNINATINQYIDENKFDLLCMVRREKGFFESLFKRSISLSQVYNSEIPILIIPENGE